VLYFTLQYNRLETCFILPQGGADLTAPPVVELMFNFMFTLGLKDAKFLKKQNWQEKE